MHNSPVCSDEGLTLETSAKQATNIPYQPLLIKPIFSVRRLVLKKTVFSAWASTLNMGLINKVDMVCLSPVGYGV